MEELEKWGQLTADTSHPTESIGNFYFGEKYISNLLEKYKGSNLLEVKPHLSSLKLPIFCFLNWNISFMRIEGAESALLFIQL